MLGRFLRPSTVGSVAVSALSSVGPCTAAVAIPLAVVRTFNFQRFFQTQAHLAQQTQHNTASPASATPSSSSSSASVDAAVKSTEATHIDNFDISPPIKAALRQNFKIENLFPIQAECYNPIVSGQDLIGRSKTGSGKTLAFVLPVVQRLRQFPPLRPPTISGGGRYGGYVSDAKCRVVILEPTRELANQVNQEILKLAHVRTAVLYGGAPAHEQARALGRGCDIVVATPGRLIDMVQRGTLSLDEVKTVVLDEADEMLRMGFQEQVENIMSLMQQQKQVLLFSATLPTWVNKTADRYLKSPTMVDKVTGFENTTPSTITHKALVTSRSLPETAELLRDVFETQNVARCIIFSKTKRDCAGLSDLLSRIGVRSRELHGDIPQNARDRTMSEFRMGRFHTLVATDVAARGLDVQNIDMVVNIGFPDDHAFYVHRSGRTGRAGKKGVSLLLYQSEERAKIAELTKEIGAKFEQLTLPTEHKGKTYPRRSLLSGKIGFTTIEVRGRNADAMHLESKLRQLSGNPHLSIGRVESGADSSFVDVVNDAIPAIEAALASQPSATMRIAADLPDEMFRGQRVSWGQKRGGGGGRGGGRSSSYGGGRGGGYGGDRSYGGGDRSYGGGNRSYGGDRSYGGGDRGERSFGGDRSRGGERSYGGDRSSYGSQRSYGGSSEGRYGNSA